MPDLRPMQYVVTRFHIKKISAEGDVETPTNSLAHKILSDLGQLGVAAVLLSRFQ